MKLTELPKTCDACGKDYPGYLPERSLSAKAKTLLAIAIVATFVWACGLWLAVRMLMPPGVYIIPVRGPAIVIWIPVLLLVCAPGYLIGWWAMLLPKVIRRYCGYCGANRAFVVDNRG